MSRRYKLFCIAKCLFSYGDDFSQNIWVKPLPKDAKSPLPVDIRRCKPSLLKLPNDTMSRNRTCAQFSIVGKYRSPSRLRLVLESKALC